MPDKAYLVQFNPPEMSAQHITAASADVYGDHLVFLNSIEAPVATFLLEIVESWTVTNLSTCVPNHTADSLATVSDPNLSSNEPKRMWTPWDHRSSCA